MFFFTQWIWEFIHHVSKKSCAYGSVFMPQINQYAIHIISQPCWPTLQLQSTCLEIAWHAMPSFTCHFFVEAFIIMSHVISHCICSMYHILTCSGRYVMFFCTSCHPPSDYWWHQCIHTCTWAISPSQRIQSLYTGKQMSTTATLFTEHCRNTN